MAKIKERGEYLKKSYQKSNQKKVGYYLDTLELTSDYFRSKSHESLFYSAIQKHNTIAKLKQLVDVSTIHRQKQYWKAFHCNGVLLQDGNSLKGSLCRKRWCQNCNRIKTAEMTNGYKQPMLDLGNLHFVTLTRPNVKGRELKSEVKKLIKTFQKIKDTMRKNHGVKLQGIRKLEVTYNQIEDTFHPHFHFIQQGKEESELLLNLWLKQFPSASRKAQDIREVNTDTDKSFVELFKYATKDVIKDTTTAKAQDTIYQAIEGIRICQTYGKIRKVKKPTEEKTEVNMADFIEPRQEIWVYEFEAKDYFNASQERLIDTQEIIFKVKLDGRKEATQETDTKSECKKVFDIHSIR